MMDCSAPKELSNAELSARLAQLTKHFNALKVYTKSVVRRCNTLVKQLSLAVPQHIPASPPPSKGKAISALPSKSTPKVIPTVPTKSVSPTLSWAQRVAMKRPEVPSNLQPNLAKAKTALRKAGFFGPPPKPDLTPVYCGGIPRSPVGALRKALTLCLPKWAVLGISFIGKYAVEFLCHKPLIDRLVTTLKSLGYQHIPGYDPAEIKNQALSQDAKLSIWNSCHQRWSVCSTKVFHPTAKEWYTSNASSLFNSKLKGIELPAKVLPKTNAPATEADVSQKPATTSSSSFETVSIGAGTISYTASSNAQSSPIIVTGDSMDVQ